MVLVQESITANRSARPCSGSAGRQLSAAAGSQKGFASLLSYIAQKANIVQAALISSIKCASELTYSLNIKHCYK